jgi:hypothetical protein
MPAEFANPTGAARAQRRDASTGWLVEQRRPSGSDLARVIAEVAVADPDEPWIKKIGADSRGRRQRAVGEEGARASTCPRGLIRTRRTSAFHEPKLSLL